MMDGWMDGDSIENNEWQKKCSGWKEFQGLRNSACNSMGARARHAEDAKVSESIRKKLSI